MHATKARALGVIAIATALVTLLVISIYCLQDWKRYESAFAQAQQYRHVLILNESLLSRIRDAQTAQLGFLLTGQSEYLGPYREALDQLPAETRELAVLLNQDPDQRARFVRLQALISAKLAELRATVDLREPRQTSAALAQLRSGQAERFMESVRSVSHEIDATESARRQAAAGQVISGAQHLRAVSLGSAVLLAALVGFAVLALRRAALETDELIAALEESKCSAEQGRDMLRATLYSIGDGVITTNRQGTVQMMNAVAERLTGFAEAEARGESVERIVHIVNEATRATVQNPVRRALIEGQAVAMDSNTLLITKTGSEIPIDDTAAPITGLSGGLTSGMVLVFRDVSERRKTADTAQRLASIVESSDDAIMGETLEGTVLTWNRGAERIFGYSADEMIGSSIERSIPPHRLAEMKHIQERVGAGEPIHQFETERLTKDRRRITVALTVCPIRDSTGRVVGVSKVARDITRQQQLEEFVQQTRKMEAVGRLAGGLAHDFNNLLTVILGYAATVNHRLAPADPLRGTVTEITRAGQRAAELTAQLLAFSRKQIIEPRVLDLNALIAQTRDMLARLIAEDIELALVLTAGPCFVKADAGQITQILMNLAVNARDAMPTGGKLTIETRTVSKEQENLGQRGVRPAGRFALISVTDTGTGMDADTAAHIFEPFFTTKEAGKGTGLGLATVYGIVTQHGGWIDVESEPERGATLRIFLPLTEAAPVETPGVQQAFAVPRKGTILLVEDQAAIRLLAEDVLRDAGHRVLSASNGQAALHLARDHGDPVDLLVTDVVMPEMSGPDLANQLLESRPGLIVLYISGYTDHALFQRRPIEQAPAFLQKPFLPETLLAKVNDLLRESANVHRAG